MARISDHQFNFGVTTVERIKAASKVHGLDTRKSLERYLCEQMSSCFTKYSLVAHMVTGGVSMPQISRQTGDLDIVFVRAMSEDEIKGLIDQSCADLLELGITLEKVSEKPDQLWIGGDMGQRYHVEANIGGTRINTHIDVSGGLKMMPYYKPQKTEGSVFFKSQVPLTAYYQSREHLCSDKIHAVVMRSDTSRWKDFADIAMLWDYRLDPVKIAKELSHRVRRDVGNDVDLMNVLPEDPHTFSTEYCREKEKIWKRWAARNHKSDGDFYKILSDAKKMYASVRSEIAKMPVYRHPKVARGGTANLLPQNFRDRTMANRLDSQDRRVVDLDDYRDNPAPGYRPKF